MLKMAKKVFENQRFMVKPDRSVLVEEKSPENAQKMVQFSEFWKT